MRQGGHAVSARWTMGICANNGVEPEIGHGPAGRPWNLCPEKKEYMLFYLLTHL